MKKIIGFTTTLLTTFIMMAQVTPPAPPAPPSEPIPPAQPGQPTLKIDGDKVTIITQKGDSYLFDDYGIHKNGVLIIGNSEAMREDMEDVQDEIEDLRNEMGDIKEGSKEYEDLMDELNDLEDELAELDEYSIPPGDSTAVTIGKWRIIVKEKDEDSDDVGVSIEKVKPEEVDDHHVDIFKTEWCLFDFGYNTYLIEDNDAYNTPSEFTDEKTWGSWDVNLHMFRSRFNMFGGFLNFNYGLSWEWHNFHYNSDFIILPRQDSLILITESSEGVPFNFKKNRFSTTHFTLPLILGFETKPWDTDKSFRMGFGYSPGLLVKGKTKVKDEDGTSKTKDDFNLAQFRHELNYSIGYGDFNVYASYDINSMFNEGEGPDAHPFSVGLIIRKGF